MKIRNLFIGDFGVFQKAEMRDIGENIVVIGGHNASGKSTFMELLRNLPYGFNKNTPSAKVNYDVQADIAVSQGDYYTISIQGYGKPSIYGQGDVKKVEEIYNGLDSYTYQKLFTISLDELNFSAKDNEKMQAVLLGAGYNEIMKIPSIKNQVIKDAKKIGGTSGRVSTAAFKPYNQRIKEGIRLNKEASENIDIYIGHKEKLKNKEREIKDINEKITIVNTKIVKFEILKTNFNDYNRIVELDEQIGNHKTIIMVKGKKEKADELLGNVKQTLNSVKNSMNLYNTKVSSHADTYKEFIKNKSKLNYINNSLSGLKEKLNYFLKEKEDLKRVENNIEANMIQINENWISFQDVLDIPCDFIEENQLFSLLDDIDIISQEIKELKIRKSEVKDEIQLLSKEFNNAKAIKETSVMKYYFILSIIFIILGIIVNKIFNSYGFLVSVVGLIGTSMSILFNYFNKSYIVNKQKDIKIKKSNYNERLRNIDEKLSAVNAKKQSYEMSLNEYKIKLKIETNINTKAFREYFKEVVNVKKDINELNAKKQELEVIKQKAIREINDVIKFISEIFSILKKPGEVISTGDIFNDYFIVEGYIKELVEGIEIADRLFLDNERKELLINEIEKLQNITSFINPMDKGIDYVETLEKYIESCSNYEKMKMLVDEKEKLLKQISQSFRIDSVSKAFNLGKNKDIDLELLKEYFNENDNLQSIEEQLDVLKGEYDSLSELYKSRIEERKTLENKLEDIAGSKNLFESQRIIDEARQELKGKAEQYAVLNTVAYMLEEVEKRFMEKTRDKLLSSAEDVLQKITDKDYNSIMLADDMKKVDFKLVDKEGRLYESSNILSRGTKEQLFLSVRVGRIKEINPPLPVILDDSLVNFDLKHTENALKVIKELSKTNQIFILTCHPYMVEEINKVSNRVDNWKLEKGILSKTESDELIEYLS